MRILFAIVAILSFIVGSRAGDGIGGTNRYEANFSREHVPYEMSKDDERWAASLLRNLKATGKAIYFTRTDLPVQKDGVVVHGLVYRRVDQPKYYYIVEDLAA